MIEDALRTLGFGPTLAVVDGYRRWWRASDGALVEVRGDDLWLWVDDGFRPTSTTQLGGEAQQGTLL